jgi:hypothetical protein
MVPTISGWTSVSFHDEFQNLLWTWFYVEHVIMKVRLQSIDSYLMKSTTYGLLFSEKTQIFFKSSFHLEKKKIACKCFQMSQNVYFG